MKARVDTSVLLRAAFPVLGDTAEAVQHRQAASLLRAADQVVVTLPRLCEFAWVLHSVYRVRREAIAAALGALLSADNVVLDRQAVQLGLQVLSMGGDFADGVIAEAGFRAGAETFVSFDREAVRLIRDSGRTAHLPA